MHQLLAGTLFLAQCAADDTWHQALSTHSSRNQGLPKTFSGSGPCVPTPARRRGMIRYAMADAVRNIDRGQQATRWRNRSVGLAAASL